jgi:hypothetical protein
MDQFNITHLTAGAPRLRVDDIARHPRLPQARKIFLDRLLDVYGDDPFLVRLLIESGRFAVFHIASALEAVQDPARRETWLTVGLLKEKMAASGLGSPRHVDQLIGRLCAVGFMQMRPHARDGRVRILVPTEKLRAHDRELLATQFAPLGLIHPEQDYGLVLRRDPQFHAHYRRTSAKYLPLGAKLMLSLPDINLFLEHAGGYTVLAALLRAAIQTGDGAQAAVPYADIGERFGVSRTHVRRLLELAKDAGLVRLHARGGRRVELLPRLWASHDRALATAMYLTDMIYRKALARWDRRIDQDLAPRLMPALPSLPPPQRMPAIASP